MNDAVFIDCVKEIVRSQMAIIGPMAIEQANKSECVVVDQGLNDVKINIEAKQAVKKLINTYADLFGKISIEVSHEAIDKALKKNNSQIDIASIIE